MPRVVMNPGDERTSHVLVSLSPRELSVLEKVMAEHGFRRRAEAMRWAFLIAAGERSLAEQSRPIAALRRVQAQRDAEREARTRRRRRKGDE